MIWLSFCDRKRPLGRQFIGVAIVPSSELVEAVLWAQQHGCNPGGEVLGCVLPENIADRVPSRFVGCLLSKADVEDFARLMA